MKERVSIARMTDQKSKQTPGLVLGKKMDAIVDLCLLLFPKFFSFLKDLDDYPAVTREYYIFVMSIVLGILGGSVTHSGIHHQAGNRLLT